MQGPLGLMDSAFKKHGQVFTVPLFHKRVTFLLGPEVSPHFYKARTVCAAHSKGRRSHARRGPATDSSMGCGLSGVPHASGSLLRGAAQAQARTLAMLGSATPAGGHIGGAPACV